MHYVLLLLNLNEESNKILFSFRLRISWRKRIAIFQRQYKVDNRLNRRARPPRACHSRVLPEKKNTEVKAAFLALKIGIFVKLQTVLV